GGMLWRLEISQRKVSASGADDREAPRDGISGYGMGLSVCIAGFAEIPGGEGSGNSHPDAGRGAVHCKMVEWIFGSSGFFQSKGNTMAEMSARCTYRHGGGWI